MKIKQIVILMLVTVMAIMAGCSSDSSNEANGDTNFPEKDIRIVIPYDPGGTSDLTSRAVADVIKEENLLDENVTVLNLPGANTRIGLEEVLNADPDGHTILLHHSTLNAMNAVGQLDISYEDYDLIGQISYTPNVLVGNADSEYQTFDEYLEAAKANPGSISVGVPNIGSTAHLAYEAIISAVGAEGLFKLVPFQSGADLITAHLGGQVDLRMASTPDSIQYVESGDVIPLVTSSLDRHFHESLQDAVSMSDLGMDTDVVVRFGFYAPKGTPQEVLDIWEETIKKVSESESFKTIAENAGMQTEFLNTEEFQSMNEKVQGVFDTLAENIDLNE
ncbi:tripartite tricarboxylate transporter substrate binding protein [Sutcliffiella deserti]|uniref:tripartite tricarboxylate transporter substrate binding protein n=1 Tax=Sutcliffiella deserti TaxID=2875501 RepID=UPI001CBCFA00|nr:tripartite tricarboxylate transporter substrate binding protein [Sutcliffiella deserti]